MCPDQTATRSVTGIVLAGGRSRRFGDTEKALAAFDGRPMLAHVVEKLASVTDTVVVNCRPEQRSSFEQALDGIEAKRIFALDERPDEGPLAGFHTALAPVETDDAVVLACDMPLVDTDSLSTLHSMIDADTDAVVPVVEGTPIPTHAVYNVPPARGQAASVLEAGDRSLQALLSRLHVEYAPVNETEISPSSLRSIDTQQELAAINRSQTTE